MIKSSMDLTSELVALCERKVEEPGPDSRWVLISELRMFSDALVAQRPAGPFWVFVYGSLIWKPTFASLTRKAGTARGWHRSFCLELDRWRATPEQHGLMMALDHGGSCAGLLCQLAEQELNQAVFDQVWREISFEHEFASVRWLTVDTDEGSVKALTFWTGPEGDGIFRKLPLKRVASVIARACGHLGSNAAYLRNTVIHLEEHGIRDRNLWHLQKLVAQEIRSLYGVASGSL